MLTATAGEAAPQAVCPTHPSREAVRTCVRCGGYVCSACERQEGQCPECTRQTALEVPDSRARALRAVVSLLITLGASFLSLLFHVGLLLMGEEGDEALEKVTAVVTTVGFLSGYGSRVYFLMWFHRVVRQLQAQGAGIGRTPGGAVWMWLIPFVNFVKPFTLMKDVAEKAGGARFAASLHLGLWWGVQLLFYAVDTVKRVLVKVVWKESGAPWDAACVLGIVMALVVVLLTLSYVRVVRELQARMDRRRAALEAGNEPVPEDEAVAA
ncbi:DUF4328 domain-containing protein [Corallococcus sp. AB032C]|nr:DUF4328 domain-containing protein [Corallococcus sp. AB032C]